MIQKIKKLFERRSVVLMYHRIATADFDPWNLCVSPKNFEEQLQVLTKYKVLPLTEAVKGKGIAITFDDGYIDNYTIAKPLLEKYKLPATFFIATGNIDSGKEFWWDQLEQENYMENWQRLFPLFPQNLQTQSRPEYLCMSSAQLKEISANNLFDIQAHTVNHPALAHQSETVQQQEIHDSRIWLQQLTGKMPMLLAYPYGNYNESTIQIAAAEKLEAAFTTDPQIITKRSAPYQLGRFQVMDWNGKEFEANLKSWLKK